jgi:hypothetical protein
MKESRGFIRGTGLAGEPGIGVHHKALDQAVSLCNIGEKELRFLKKAD